MKSVFVSVIVIAAGVNANLDVGLGCGSKQRSKPAPVTKPDVDASVKAPVAPKVEVPVGPTVAATIAEGLATPESVLFDAENDRYLISNINGTPLTVDNNGYIATMAPDGTAVEKWIVGGANKVTLNAPKGMAIVAGVLYVTDITTVRKFDLKTGAPKGEIKVTGATFLNDLAVGPNDTVYVSDSGLKAGKADFEPTGTDAVYKIDTKAKAPKAVKVAKDKSLDKPNGLLVNAAGQVWVAPFGAKTIYMLDEAGKKALTDIELQRILNDHTLPQKQRLLAEYLKMRQPVELPGGGLDGILDTGKHIIVSSWEKSTIYAAPVGDTLIFAPLIENVSSPADIGYDSKRNRLLVPRFMDNKVEVYQLPEAK